MIRAQCERIHHHTQHQYKKKSFDYDLSHLFRNIPCTELDYSRIQEPYLMVLTDYV